MVCIQETSTCLGRLQDEHDLEFRRVLYFLPHRGPLERADGTLQEELKLIHVFFGIDVFKIMVVVVTNFYKTNRAQIELEKEDIEVTKAIFMEALEMAVDTSQGEIVECPPLIYLPYLEKNIMEKIKTAPVLHEQNLSKTKVVYYGQNPLKEPKGVRLYFQDRCVRCSARLIYSSASTKCYLERIVVNDGGEEEHMVSYKHSKCHPVFNSKARERNSLLYWFRPIKVDEVCAVCGKETGSEPCTLIGELFQWETNSQGILEIRTSHSGSLHKKVDVK